MDLINICTLVFDIDAIVLHTNPNTVGEKKSCSTHCNLCLTLSNVEIHYLYVSFILASMICVSQV